jgi:hypothetical protein
MTWVADERFAAPVHGNEGEQAMFYLVPLAGAGRQMVHHNVQPGLVGEALQFPFPQLHFRAVAAAAVRCDRQAGGPGVARLAQLLPPAANARHGKCAGIGVYADTDQPWLAAIS